MAHWLFGALLLNTATAFFIGAMVNHRLRYEHPAIWVKLGRPSFLNNSPANAWRSANYYLFSSKYKQLSDSVFDKLALAAKINAAMQVALMVAFGIAGYFES